MDAKERTSPEVLSKELVEKAKDLIREFCREEYEDDIEISDLTNIALAFSTWESGETGEPYTIESRANIVKPSILMYVNGKLRYEKVFDDLDQMIDQVLINLDFNALTTPPDRLGERLNLEKFGAVITSRILTEFASKTSA